MQITSGDPQMAMRRRFKLLFSATGVFVSVITEAGRYCR